MNYVFSNLNTWGNMGQMTYGCRRSLPHSHWYRCKWIHWRHLQMAHKFRCSCKGCFRMGMDRRQTAEPSLRWRWLSVQPWWCHLYSQRCSLPHKLPWPQNQFWNSGKFRKTQMLLNNVTEASVWEDSRAELDVGLHEELTDLLQRGQVVCLY